MNKAISIILLFLGLSCSLYSQKLDLPESATYHIKSNAYYITSIKNSTIVKQDKTGKKTLFCEIPSPHSLGITNYNNTLYIVADDQIIGIDIASKKQNFIITIKEAQQLNDITADETGNLYVSDRIANNIYRITIATKKYTPLTKPNTIVTPNGVFYDQNSKLLLVCNSVEKSEIFSINSVTGEVKTLYKTNFPNFDGIVMDNHQNIYVTSWDKDWKISKLIRFSKKEKQPKIIINNAKGMADLNYNTKEDKLIITNSFDNSITLLKSNQ